MRWVEELREDSRQGTSIYDGSLMAKALNAGSGWNASEK